MMALPAASVALTTAFNSSPAAGMRFARMSFACSSPISLRRKLM